MKRLHTRALTLMAAGLAACATGSGPYDQPYALIEPHGRTPTDDQRPAFVLGIDGKSRDIRDNTPVTPGKHRVELSIPGPPGLSTPQQVLVEMDVKPCMRYRMGATRSDFGARDWKPAVVETEPIGECLRKFPDVKP